MKIGILLPDHGGRDELIDFALGQICKQTVKPDAIMHIDKYQIRPNGSTDLLERLRIGVDQARQSDIEFLLIWEDDFYPSDYIERFIPYTRFDFVGQEYTHYYQLKNKAWERYDHPRRSSLFTTGLKVSALDSWDWKALRPDTAFVDIKLWEYAHKKTKAFIDTGAIGIKTGIGRCAGKGHLVSMRNKDEDFSFLKSKVDKEAFEFYMDLHNKLIA